MEVYDDALTYRLVGAAAEVLGASPAALLEQFGEFWIRFTASEGYGHLIDMFGNDFEAFLSSLDAMHARVWLGMPSLLPPSFVFQRGEDGNHRLIYRSTRAGLAPMVVGLLRGLALRFGVDVEVRLLARPVDADHDVFLLRRTG